MEFTGIPPATAQLAIELQLADIKAILLGPEDGDGYAAFKSLRASLQEALSLFQDQVFAIDLVRADYSTRVVFDTLVQEERQAQRDHGIACEMSGIVPDQPTRTEDDGVDQSLWVDDDCETTYLVVADVDTPDVLTTTMDILADPFATAAPRQQRARKTMGEPMDSQAGCSAGSGTKGKGTVSEALHEGEHQTHTLCSVCLEPCPRFDALELGCKQPEDATYHSYCRECLTDLFRTSLTDTTLFPPKCCRKRIPIAACMELLAPSLIHQYREKELELAMPNPVYCSNRYCAKFVRSEHILADVATCQSCGDQTCSVCKGPRHNGLCPEDQTVQVLMEMAGEKRWQRCPRCRTMVELLVGCYHMR